MIDLSSYSEQIKKLSDILYPALSGSKCTHTVVLDTAKSLMSIVFKNKNLDTEYEKAILNKVVDDYEIEIGIKTYMPDIIAKDKQSRFWLQKIKKSIHHPFFDRYKQYLRQRKFNNKVIDNIEGTCEEILSFCANPKNPGGIEKKRGLVVGDVQSGKTANYLGLINMAFDYGYKIVVLLAGTTNSLRKQTQKRMDSGVIGAISDTIGGVEEYIGVGFENHEHYAIPFTNQANDFSKFIQYNLNANINDFNKPVVLVVKKVKSILESVGDRLQSALNEKGVLDAKNILIIDDEADNASVNTKTNEDPTVINRSIRNIFNKFPIATYVGYTATPFANIFIDPNNKEEDLDLFPADFIVQLHAPDNYFGGRRVFSGDTEHLPRCLRKLETNEMFFLPVVHEKNTDFPELPNSLKEAIHEFLINNVIRTIRGQKKEHRTMMINITAYNDVQSKIERKVSEYITILKNAIEQLGNLSVADFDKDSNCREIHNMFDTDFYKEIREGNIENSTAITWNEIKTGLYDEIKDLVVTVINSRNGNMNRRNKEGQNSRFDYEDYEETGARVIAIGGMVLSRGLTLEGLMTSYYSRNAGSYDTLLQMCRWFGYRPGYQDLCRVYLSQENIDRFDAVLTAVEDMKSQFSEMQRKGKTPKDFGLMIMESPEKLETSLLITNRNKMKNSETKIYQLNYGGVYSDTSKILRDKNINMHNFKCTENFIKSVDFKLNHEKYFASNVPSSVVAQFIRQLKISYVNKKFDTEGLSDYIEQSKVFTKWDVVIADGDSKKLKNCFGLNINASERSFHVKDSGDEYIRIGGHNNRVLDPRMFDYGLWLTKEQKELILKRRSDDTNSLSALDYLNERDNPILIIYPIDLKTDLMNDEKDESIKDFKVKIKEEVNNDKIPLMAFAYGFPLKESSEKLIYKINKIKIEELKKYESGFEYDDEGEGVEDDD